MVVSVLLSMLSLVCDDTLRFRDQCLSQIGKLVSDPPASLRPFPLVSWAELTGLVSAIS